MAAKQSVESAPQAPMASEPSEPPGPPRKSEAEQAGVLVWGRIAAKISEVLTPLLLARLLGKADVGAFAALFVIYETVLVFLTAGMPRAALYFLGDRSLADRRATVVRMTRFMLWLGAAAGLVLASIGWLADDLLRVIGEWMVSTFGTAKPDPLGPEYGYLTLLGLYALVDVPTRILPSVLLAEGRPKASAGVGVVRSLGMVLATMIPAAVGWGVGGIMAGTIVFGFAYALYSLWWLARLYRGVPPAERSLAGRSIPSMRELNRYALSLGMTDIVSKLNANLDVWLIVIFFATEQVAEFKFGAWQLPIVTTIAYSVGDVYVGPFKKLFNEGKGREALAIWRESITKVSLIVVPISAVFVIAAEEFVTLAFTDAYIAAAPVFRCYCLLTAMRVTAFGNVMLAAGRPDYVLRSAGFTLASNLVISVPLVLVVGFVGAAIGTVVAFVPTVFYYCWFIAKASRVSVRDTFPLWAYLRVVLVCAPVCGLAWWLKLALVWHPAAELGVVALIVTVGFALLGTAVGLITRDDWRFAADWARLRQMK